MSDGPIQELEKIWKAEDSVEFELLTGLDSNAGSMPTLHGWFAGLGSIARGMKRHCHRDARWQSTSDIETQYLHPYRSAASLSITIL